MGIKIITVVALIALITISYKLLPFRLAGSNKPSFAIFPKYKRKIIHKLNYEELEAELSKFGFKRTSKKNGISIFSRGSILGDISIKSSKVNIGLKKLSDSEHEITIQAGWVVAFDTGDHWQFLNELCKKIESA